MVQCTFFLVALAVPLAHANPVPIVVNEPAKLKVRILGLFAMERIGDFRLLLDKLKIKILELDFHQAEGILEFDPAKVLSGAKLQEYTSRLDELVRNSSQGTFGLKPPGTTPKNKLKRIEIPVLGLDCKACCLAAYEIVARLDGVEQATASFKEGRITALIDPGRIQLSQLETTLKERGVTLKK